MTVDVKALSVEEAKEYERLLAAKAALPEAYDATSWRLPGRVWGVIVAWFVIWAASLALIAWWAMATGVRGPSGGIKFELGILILGLVVLIAGAVFPIYWTINDHKRIRADLASAQANIDDFLKRIDYERRAKPGRHYDDGMTLRQSQHAWYRGHSELNWTHRVQGESMGFDNADDYVNNFLESDK